MRQFASIELIQKRFPGGWFFAVFEMLCDNNVGHKTASANQTDEVSENQGIDNQHLLNEPSDIRNCNYVCQLKPRIKNCKVQQLQQIDVKLTADRLAQLVEYRTAVREVAGSNLDRTNTQGL